MSLAAKDLRGRLAGVINGNTCVVAIDGGTVGRVPYLSCTVGCGGNAYFWSATRVRNFTAATITATLRTVFGQVSALGGQPLGVVSDNASAMLAATAAIATNAIATNEGEDDEGEGEGEGEEEEEDEVDVDDGENSEDDEGPEQAVEYRETEEPQLNDLGLFQIKCWSHSFQLMFGDLARRNKYVREAFSCISRLYPLLTKRQARADLRKLCVENKKPFSQVPTPAVTRWNSHVRAIYCCYILRDEIAVVLGKNAPSDREVFSMAVTCVICVPFAWSSDETQSDNCTAEDGDKIVQLCLSRLNFVASIEFQSDLLRKEFADAIADCKAVLEKRRRNHLDCVPVRLLRFFDAEEQDELETDFVVDHVARYWTTNRKVAVDKDEILREVQKFRMRQRNAPTEKDKDKYSWWKKFAPIRLFVEACQSLLLSEASVERSFSTQARIFPPVRNRLAQQQVNNELFVACNYKKLIVHLAKPRKVRHWITEALWKELCLSVSQPDGDKRKVTRARTKAEKAQALGIGSRVKVAFIEDGVKNYYNGTVLQLNMQTNIHVIVYDSESKRALKFVEFAPTAEDNDWDFIAETGKTQ